MRKCKDIIEELHEANLLNFILASLISADTLINEESCEKSMKEMKKYISAIDDTNIESEKKDKYKKLMKEGLEIIRRDLILYRMEKNK